MRLLILSAWISCLLLLWSMGIELGSSNLLAQSPLPTELSCQTQLCLTSLTKSLWILFSNYNFHLNISFSQWRLLGKWDAVSVSHLTVSSFVWVLGSELRSVCLRAAETSPQPQVSFLKCSLISSYQLAQFITTHLHHAMAWFTFPLLQTDKGRRLE